MRLVCSWERPAWQARLLRWAYHHLCRLWEWAGPRFYDLAYWEHRPDTYRQEIRRARQGKTGMHGHA